MSDLTALRALRGFIFDMDGVIYRGRQVLPGAAELVTNLRRAGVPFLFLTNNSTTPPTAVAERLIGMGIPVDPAEILTSAEATAEMLASEMPGCRVLVVGEQGIQEALLAAGLSIVSAHQDADAVVVGLDRQCTYAKLREAALAIRRGARFVATNPDRSFPTEEGLVPGAGALVAALELATDVKAQVIGKPEPAFFLHALRRLGTPPPQTIAVLTGTGTRAQFAAMHPPPDWVFNDLVELNQAYFGTP